MWVEGLKVLPKGMYRGSGYSPLKSHKQTRLVERKVGFTSDARGSGRIMDICPKADSPHLTSSG